LRIVSRVRGLRAPGLPASRERDRCSHDDYTYPASRESRKSGSKLHLGEPPETRQEQCRGHVEIEPQAEDVVSRIDAHELLEDPKAGVTGNVESEQPAWADPAMVAEPDERAGKAEVPHELV
jgi:hypothetical protein